MGTEFEDENAKEKLKAMLNRQFGIGDVGFSCKLFSVFFFWCRRLVPLRLSSSLGLSEQSWHTSTFFFVFFVVASFLLASRSLGNVV